MKRYTEAELKKRVSKKYHDMIDWQATMSYGGFDGDFYLKENGQATTVLAQSLYGAIANVNWYLKRVQENPDIQW